MKHTYGERACMACGGKVCSKSYSDLREQVEKEKLGGDGIKKGEMAPLGRYAEGGPVTSPSPKPAPVSEGGWNTFTAGMNKALGSQSASASEPVKKAHGGMMEAGATIDDKIGNPFKADGGEIEEGGGDDDMLMDHCAGEMMSAIEKGDKAAFKDALHVLVADCLSKLGKE